MRIDISRQGKYAPVAAVERAAQILDLLSRARDGLALREISSSIEANKSFLFKILTSLERSGLVLVDPGNHRYRLAQGLVLLAFRYLEGIEFYDYSMPVVRTVAEKTGELTQLAVAEGDRFHYLAKAEGAQRLKVVSLVGQPVELHAQAMGKAWLAALPEDRALRLLALHEPRAFTSRTITSLEKLRQELERTRERGYAISDEEFAEGVYGLAIAVVVPRLRQLAVGAMSIGIPKSRLSDARVEELLRVLRNATEELAAIWPFSAEFTGA